MVHIKNNLARIKSETQSLSIDPADNIDLNKTEIR